MDEAIRAPGYSRDAELLQTWEELGPNHDGTEPDASSITELQAATASFTLEVKLPEAHSRGFRVRGSENLEWATLACLSDTNFSQALPLCLVRAFVDKNDTTAVAAMNRVRPANNECDAQPIESRSIECAFPNFPGINRLAGSVRGNHR
jgi:hypothetical protein